MKVVTLRKIGQQTYKEHFKLRGIQAIDLNHSNFTYVFVSTAKDLCLL